LVDDFYTSQNIPSPTTPSETSLAGAIVDQVAHRKIQVTEALVESQGYAWIIANEELQNTMSLVKSTLNIILSPNSALSVAALIQAQKNNRTFSGPVVCLITGN
jgi:threonine synthase